MQYSFHLGSFSSQTVVDVLVDVVVLVLVTVVVMVVVVVVVVVVALPDVRVRGSSSTIKLFNFQVAQRQKGQRAHLLSTRYSYLDHAGQQPISRVCTHVFVVVVVVVVAVAVVVVVVVVVLQRVQIRGSRAKITHISRQAVAKRRTPLTRKK